MHKRRRIAAFTGTRAEYGLIHRLLQKLSSDENVELQIIASGTHLSPEYGLTADEITQDGLLISMNVEMLLSSDTAVGITKSMGVGLIGMADAIANLKPDLMFLVGDRFETFIAATSCLIANIPIAHCHGGELTEAAFDDSLRHSITKMANIHFVANEEYRLRVIQLGENPMTVHRVGGLGASNIRHRKLLGKEELENKLGIRFKQRNLMITYHSETLNNTNSAKDFNELLEALSCLRETQLIFTLPNADTNGRMLMKMTEDFCNKHANAVSFASLGQYNYFSCLHYCDGVVGNSSSGLTEAPSFNIGTVNIGDRQKGRLKADSVIDCAAEHLAIRSAINRLFDSEFKTLIERATNPYDLGDATDAIFKILVKCPIPSTVKTFFDVPHKELRKFVDMSA